MIAQSVADADAIRDKYSERDISMMQRVDEFNEVMDRSRAIGQGQNATIKLQLKEMAKKDETIESLN